MGNGKALAGSAIVTGARRGLGKAIAVQLASDGFGVILCDVSDVGLEQVASDIRGAGGQCFAILADVSSSEDMRGVVAEATARFGPLTCAVNNAAIPPPLAQFHEIEDGDWERHIAINLDGVFFGMKHQIAAMLNNGGGAIVNISSMAAKISVRGSHVYSVAKRGILAMTSCAAIEYADRGIRVNAVLPGYMSGELADEVERANPGIAEQFGANIPMGRYGRPEEIAQLVSFLSGEGASYITGQAYACDGGCTA